MRERKPNEVTPPLTEEEAVALGGIKAAVARIEHEITKQVAAAVNPLLEDLSDLERRIEVLESKVKD